MINITFDKFKNLTQFKHFTLKDFSIEICGDNSLTSFLSKLATHSPVSVAGNFKMVDEWMAKFGYHLILDNDFNNSLTIKDKLIIEQQQEIARLKDINQILLTRLEALTQIEQAINVLNSLSDNDMVCRRPKYHKKGIEKYDRL